MPSKSVAPILVVGATGRIGRQVVAALDAAGHRVRALTRRPASAAFSENVDVVTGDLTIARVARVGDRRRPGGPALFVRAVNSPR